MSGTTVLHLLAAMAFIGAVVTTIVLTRNSTKLRQNFFRSLTYLVGLPLFFLSTSLVGPSEPPKATDFFNDSETVNVRQVRDEMHYYADQTERYLDSQRFEITLALVVLVFFSVLPTASLAYNFMRHMEKYHPDDENKVF